MSTRRRRDDTGSPGLHACGLVSRPVPGRTRELPALRDELSFRKSASIQRTWAFLIAAAVCYVPANVLRCSRRHGVGRDSDTILGRRPLWSPTAGRLAQSSSSRAS